VKDVWHIAGPCEQRISLNSLRGQTLAIDLAGWVVQNNSAPGLQVAVTRPHLRNIFFRVSTLLSLDILPVVILDGSCPELKSQTVAARNKQVWGARSGPDQVQSPKRQQRRQFTGVLKDCSHLLQSLGVPCVTAPGEAEAFCAALNQAGLVDGVVSDDSDCFCYGARTVLRNFSTDPKSFSVSAYTVDRLEAEVGLSRERMVVMALLLGCDYNLGGVAGVGREAVLKLFQVWGPPRPGELDLVLGWRLQDEAGDIVTSKPVHCGTCGHAGSVASHRRLGCEDCGTASNCRSDVTTHCSCLYHSETNQRLLAEWNIKQKAVSSPGWPHHNVVQEFYKDLRSSLPSRFRWGQPSPDMFVSFSVKKMNWLRDYSVEKVIETVVQWQVKNAGTGSVLVSPLEIVKKRIKSGENMFEVQWSSSNSAVLPQTFVAFVSSTVFSESYPAIYQDYQDKLDLQKAAKKKPKKTKSSAPKETKKKEKKTTVNQPTLDLFVKNNKENVEPKNNIVQDVPMIQSKKQMCKEADIKQIDALKATKIINVNNKSLIAGDDNSCDENDSNFLSESMKEYLEEDDESDLSHIVDEIIGQSKTVSATYSTSTPSFYHLPSFPSIPKTQTASPMLKNMMKKKVKASDVFDLSNVSLVLNECVEKELPKSTNNFNEAESPMDCNFSDEESFDEFDCLETASSTPLAERLR